jgi:hypothetical protein
MPTQRKPRRVRKPFSDEEDEAGAAYFDAAAREQILRSFVAKPDFDEAKFFETIELAAWVYVLMSAEEESTARLPYESMRTWDSLDKLASKLVKSLLRLPAAERGHLTGAAESLADREGLNEFEAEFALAVPLPSAPPDQGPRWIQHWPVWKKFDQLNENLHWLTRCLAEARSREAQGMAGRKGGNRADEPQHEFVRAVTGIYWKAAKGPSFPSRDARKGEARGELIKLLSACLSRP